MSIASEISRLQSAKADIKTSIEAKGVTVPSATTLDGYSTLIDQISGGGGTGDFIYKIRAGEQTTISATESAVLQDLVDMNLDYQLYALFYGTKLVTADLSEITSLNKRLVSTSMFSYCGSLTTFDLSNLTILGNAAGQNMFAHCPALTSADLPSLTSIHSPSNMFDGCTHLISFSAPLLATLAGGNFGAFLRNCNALQEVTIHPNMLSGSSAVNNILGYATSNTFTKLRLSTTATNNVYLSWQGALDSSSILDVLNHLSTQTTGKTCAFKNLTVSSSDTNYAAISAKVSSLTNWTITGLTL